MVRLGMVIVQFEHRTKITLRVGLTASTGLTVANLVPNLFSTCTASTLAFTTMNRSSFPHTAHRLSFFIFLTPSRLGFHAHAAEKGVTILLNATHLMETFSNPLCDRSCDCPTNRGHERRGNSVADLPVFFF